MSLEYLENDLETVIRKQKVISLKVSCSIVKYLILIGCCFDWIPAHQHSKNVHDKNVIHRDIKPNNILFHPKTKDAFLIDFGLAKKFKDESGNHIQMNKKAAFRGTYKFCSVATHDGIEQSRRSDMESLGYVLVYIQKGKPEQFEK